MRDIIFVIAFGLVLFTPFVYLDVLYDGIISAKQIWFYGSMSFLLLVTVFYLLFNRKELVYRLNVIDISLFAFFTYYFIRASTTPYMPLLHNQRFIYFTLGVIFYFTLKYILGNEKLICANKCSSVSNDPDKRSPLFSSLLPIFLIISAFVQAIWRLLQLYGVLPSFNNNFKITGSFFNPAPYALYLAIIFPLALWKMFLNNGLTIDCQNNPNVPDYVYQKVLKRLAFNLNKYIPGATVLTIIVILPATMIRAAWVGAIIGSLIVLQFRYKYVQSVKQYLNTTIRRILAVAVFVTIILTLGAGIFLLKKDSASGKLFIWEVTLGKIIEKPLFGYGVGRFEAEYNNWQAEYFMKHPNEMDGHKGMVAGNTKYAFNEFLEIGSETGIVGVILFVILILSVFLPFPNPPQIWRVIEHVKYTSMFASIIFCAFFSFPFYSLPTLILFFMILAVISSQRFYPSIPIVIRTKMVKYFLRFAASCVLITLSITLSLKAKRMYVAYYIFDEACLLYQNTYYPEACQSFAEILPVMQFNGEYLQFYGKALNMTGQYRESKIFLDYAKKFTSDEILYTSIGENYEALKLNSEAEQAYKKAMFMMPHKVYPLYLQVKFYWKNRDMIKAKTVAQQILRKPVKVESKALDEIKEEVKTIILDIQNYHNR